MPCPLQSAECTGMLTVGNWKLTCNSRSAEIKIMKSMFGGPDSKPGGVFGLRRFLLTCIFGRRSAYEVQLANSPRGKTCLKWTTTTLPVTVLIFLTTFWFLNTLCFLYDTLDVANSCDVCNSLGFKHHRRVQSLFWTWLYKCWKQKFLQWFCASNFHSADNMHVMTVFPYLSISCWCYLPPLAKNVCCCVRVCRRTLHEQANRQKNELTWNRDDFQLPQVSDCLWVHILAR